MAAFAAAMDSIPTRSAYPLPIQLPPAEGAVMLSHCRFSIAVLSKPLRIGDPGDFVGIVTNHLQFILRERRMLRLPNLA